MRALKLQNPCSNAAIFMFERNVFHAQIARKPFPNTAKIMLDSCRIHAETQPERCRPPHGIMRRRRFAPANPRLGSAAPPAIIVALRAAALRCRVPGNSPTSLSGIVGQWTALPTIERRRCDSVSRSFLCARALPQRSRLRFRTASEFS